MFQTLKNAWRTKEIRSKIIFTLFILLLYRIGTVIPVPFVDANEFSSNLSGTILDFMNTLSGGALGAATLFALGVSPYINASIIIQLLAVVFPKLGEIAKNDKKKMNFITRIVSMILALVTAIGYYYLLKNSGALSITALHSPRGWLYAIVIIASYCAGAAIIMWLGERINEKGIGNGISLILFANIVSVVPSFIIKLVNFIVETFSYKDYNETLVRPWLYPLIAIVFSVIFIVFMVALIVFVVLVTGSERRLPIQYAKKVVGRKMYGGQSSHLPLKLNMTGVMPIIFASSIVSLVPTIIMLCQPAEGTFWFKVNEVLSADGFVYPTLLFVLIIAFAYFYTQITFDPMEVANNLQRQGGAIPGIRQGRPTSVYIKKVLSKVTLVGALFLGIIAVLPVILGPHAIEHLLTWIQRAMWANPDSEYVSSLIAGKVSELSGVFTFGGTTLLIMVGVAIETFREIEAQLTMRNYKGFLN
ncbi:MAG: preprotein translocase subunit SecY [Clostridia bacterium]|nr:preprotein translocase subunit SecY [Clostridia bacterium]